MGGGIDQSVSPGMGGFLAFFLLACALWLLMRNMLKHMRSLSYREEREEKQERLAGGPEPVAGTPEGDEPAAPPGAPASPDSPESPGSSTSPGPSAPDEVQTRPSSLSAGYPREPQV